MLFGIAAGLVSALLQSVSYLCSAGFMLKYRSPLRLVIFSQLVMGAFCLPFVPFVFPRGLQDRLPEFAMWVCVWLVVFSIGQVAFFSALRSIESSRISSLLGLKIVVLAFLYVVPEAGVTFTAGDTPPFSFASDGSLIPGKGVARLVWGAMGNVATQEHGVTLGADGLPTTGWDENGLSDTSVVWPAAAGVVPSAGAYLYKAAKDFIRQSEKAVEKARAIQQQTVKTIRLGSSLLNPGNLLIDLWNQVSPDPSEYRIKMVPYSDDRQKILSVVAKTNFLEVTSIRTRITISA